MTVAELTARISVIGEAAAVRAMRNVGNAARGVGEAIRTAADATRLLDAAQASFATVTGVQAAMAYDSQVRGLAAYAKNAQELQAQLGRLQEIAKLPGLGLKEVRAGVLQLEAAGLNAQTAERALMAFGNALALVGKGKNELDGVILALGQIASKGSISAEEINQIAERVPQIRQVLVQAFGTASTEAIQKMGISADEAIKRIISGLERLPKATQSALTTFENLQDALEQAFLPIGRGILDIFGASESGATRVIDLVAGIARQIGEVFSAIGKSGVIQKFFDIFISGTGAANFQDAMITGIAKVIGFIATIPMLWTSIIHDINVGWTYVKDWMIYTFGDAFDVLKIKFKDLIQSFKFETAGLAGALEEFLQPTIDMLKLMGVIPSDGKLFNTGILTQPSGNKIEPLPQRSAPIAPQFALPAYGAYLQELQRNFEAMIRGALGPQGLPPGMIFGGAQGTGGMGENTIGNLLGKIADNTRTTADALTLRRETLGGGKLGAMGVTAAELAVGGGGGIRVGDFMGGGNRGLIPAGTELERAVRSVIRDEARRNGTPGIMKRF